MNSKFPLQLAKEAIILSKYTEAIQLLRPLAEDNNSEAQFLYGYFHFLNSELSQTQAIEYIQKAASSGHAEANYTLASCPALESEYSFQLPTDGEAWERLQYAANQGSTAAMIVLAQAHLDGIDVVLDVERARELLTEVTNRKRIIYPEACYRLGMMQLQGIGGDANLEQGIRLLMRCQNDKYAAGDPFVRKSLDIVLEVARERLYGISKEAAVGILKDSFRFSWIPHSEKIQSNWQRHIGRYCRNALNYDLAQSTFDEFVAFHFEHFLVERDSEIRWNQLVEVNFDPKLFVKYYTQLFQSPEFLLQRYERNLLDKGFWNLRYMNPWSVPSVIFSANVTIDEAEICLRAMYDLFEKLFAVDSLNNSSCHMWWESPFDLVSVDIIMGNMEKRADDEISLRRLFQAAFETIVWTLKLDSRDCKAAALHGLGHLNHPDKEQVIRQFLEDNPQLSEWREYALAAIEGKIM